MTTTRRFLWRLGRWMYMAARNDVANRISANGETLVQSSIVNAQRKLAEPFLVFDVGANVGQWSTSMLDQIGAKSDATDFTIHAFEPVPKTIEALRATIRQHPLGGLVTIVPIAMSSRSGDASLFVGDETAGTHSLHADPSSGNLRKIGIALETIDEYCKLHQIERLHFVKCDTEGHDMEVMLGAARMIGEERILAMQFEYNHRWIFSRHYLKDVFDFVRLRTYFVGKVTPGGIEFYRTWHPELERFFEGNYLIVHRSALDWFPHRFFAISAGNAICTENGGDAIPQSMVDGQ